MEFRTSVPSTSNYAVSTVSSASTACPRQRISVGFLTKIRRLFDVRSRFSGTVAVTILLLGSTASAADTQWHAPADIEKTAEAFVLGIVGTSDQRITPQAGRLDRRLQLPACTEPLEAFQQGSARLTSRTIVGVRCNGSSPWKIYVPVDVIVTESVLIARHPLTSGHIFTANDVIAEDRDVSRLVGGYVTNAASLVGKQLKHSLMTGRVITPSMLKASIMIRRGESVTIVARNGGVSIRMMGKALADGAENQRIRVENAESKRVIEGIVRSPGQVEVLVY